MCLDYVGKVYPSDDDFVGTGWKVFRVNYKNELSGEYYNDNIIYKYNTWYESNSITISDYYKYSYMSGFHIFLNKEDAMVWKRTSGPNYIIKQVKYKNPMYLGGQLGELDNCIVAKQIMIL